MQTMSEQLICVAEREAKAFQNSPLGKTLPQDDTTAQIIASVLRKYSFPLTKTGFHCAALVALHDGLIQPLSVSK